MERRTVIDATAVRFPPHPLASTEVGSAQEADAAEPRLKAPRVARCIVGRSGLERAWVRRRSERDTRRAAKVALKSGPRVVRQAQQVTNTRTEVRLDRRATRHRRQFLLIMRCCIDARYGTRRDKVVQVTNDTRERGLTRCGCIACLSVCTLTPSCIKCLAERSTRRNN